MDLIGEENLTDVLIESCLFPCTRISCEKKMKIRSNRSLSNLSLRESLPRKKNQAIPQVLSAIFIKQFLFLLSGYGQGYN